MKCIATQLTLYMYEDRKVCTRVRIRNFLINVIEAESPSIGATPVLGFVALLLFLNDHLPNLLHFVHTQEDLLKEFALLKLVNVVTMKEHNLALNQRSDLLVEKP